MKKEYLCVESVLLFPLLIALELLSVSCVIQTILFTVFVDIDECADGIDGCTQICTNANGTYTCSCSSGYRLASNRRMCNGEWLI